MLFSWVAPFTHGYADFYRWDGSFLRQIDVPGSLLASRDGRYFVNFTTRQLWTAAGQRIRAFKEPTLSTALNWAADGDYFCGLEQNAAGYDLVVVDVPGNVKRFELDVPSALVTAYGLHGLRVECSMTAHRAVVFGGSLPNYEVAVMSLPDGHLERVVQLGKDFSASGVTWDMRWLAETSTDNGWETDVVDLADGSIQAKVSGYFEFTPDGQHLVGTDSRGAVTPGSPLGSSFHASVLDWRTKTELWTGVGHVVRVMADSDPSTNKMLLWLSTGFTQGGADTYDYWIVDGAGSAVRFTPHDCVSMASYGPC